MDGVTSNNLKFNNSKEENSVANRNSPLNIQLDSNASSFQVQLPSSSVQSVYSSSVESPNSKQELKGYTTMRPTIMPSASSQQFFPQFQTQQCSPYISQPGSAMLFGSSSSHPAVVSSFPTEATNISRIPTLLSPNKQMPFLNKRPLVSSYSSFPQTYSNSGNNNASDSSISASSKCDLIDTSTTKPSNTFISTVSSNGNHGDNYSNTNSNRNSNNNTNSNTSSVLNQSPLAIGDSTNPSGRMLYSPVMASSPISSATPGGAPVEGMEPFLQERIAKQKHAMDFLYKVRVQYQKNPAVYNQFLEIMREFKGSVIDTPEVITRVKELFRGNNYLINEFNAFLPTGFKIEPEPESEPVPDGSPSITGSQQDLDHARKYVRKIKSRFAQNPQIYKTFLEILHSYYQGRHLIDEVLREVTELFSEHLDLLEEFRQFLPRNSNEVVSQEGNLVSQPSSVVSPTFPGGGKRIKKKSQPFLGTSSAGILPTTSIQPNHHVPPRERIGDREKDRRRGQMDDRKRRRMEENGRRNYDAREERYIREQSKRIEQTFFDEAKERLSPYLFHEFLQCVNLFSQEILSKSELIQLCKFLFSGNPDLFERLKEFVAVNENDADVKVEPVAVPIVNRRSNLSNFPRNGNTSENGNKDEEIAEEGDRVELDLMVEMNSATLRSFEALIQENEGPGSKPSVESLDAFHLRTVERMYGDCGAEVIEALHETPLAVIPVIIKRLRQRNQELLQLRNQVANAYSSSSTSKGKYTGESV